MSTKGNSILRPFKERIPIHKLEDGYLVIGEDDIRISSDMKITSNYDKSHTFSH